MDEIAEVGSQQTEPPRALVRRPPWSLLQSQWLEVPIGEGSAHANLTWGAFSVILGTCLWRVSRHVGQRVQDRARVQGIVTEAIVENLEVLVSPLDERVKSRRLLAAADRLIAREAGA